MTYIGTECEHPQVTSQRSRRTRARALVAAAAVLAVSVTAACSSSAPSGAVTNSTLTVAAFNPFTGPDASYGPEMMAGCLTAAAAVNAAGGVLGNKVVCAIDDTRGDPADAVTAGAKMLATTPHLLGVLGPSSDEADSTAPLINAAKVTMFADTGEASFDHTTLPYFWRMTPGDDVLGYAMAFYAKQKGYLRAAAVFGNDIGSQSVVPTLLKGYSAVGGQMVLYQKIAENQTSYQPEVQQLIAQHPQVIFTEADPQSDATYLAELQQLGHLIPVIGSNATIEPGWLSAVAAAIGKPAMSQVLHGRDALRRCVGARVAGVQQGPAGHPRGDQAGVAVERRRVLDGGLRRAHRHGAGRDRGEEHQPGRIQCVHPGGHHGFPGGGGGVFVRGRPPGAQGRQEDRLRRCHRGHPLGQVAQLGRRVRDPGLPGDEREHPNPQLWT